MSLDNVVLRNTSNESAVQKPLSRVAQGVIAVHIWTTAQGSCVFG